MAFTGDDRELISNLNELATVFQALTQAITDNGGNMGTLNKLLADAKGNRKAITQLARSLVGKMWELVEQPVNLELEDFHFECFPRDFEKMYPGLAFDSVATSRAFSDTRPSGPCRYRLHHFGRKMLAEEIYSALDDDPNLEHAGWRELTAYVFKLKLGDFKDNPIFAAGSLAGFVGRFPMARDTTQGARISIGGLNTSAETTTWKFPTGVFWLVRDYATKI